MKLTIEFDPFSTDEVSSNYSDSKTYTIRMMLSQVADRIDDALWRGQAKKAKFGFFGAKKAKSTLNPLNPKLKDRNGKVMGSVKIRLSDEERA